MHRVPTHSAEAAVRSRTSLLAALIPVLLLAIPASAQSGPFQVGTLIEATMDGPDLPNAPTPNAFSGALAVLPLKVDVYYPIAPQGPNSLFVAPPGGGPHFPIVVFLHGYGGHPQDYGNFLSAIASWGFIVLAPRYVRPPGFEAPVEQAYEAWLMLQKMREEAIFSTGVFPGVTNIDPAPDAHISLVGHSMGTVSGFYLSGAEEDVRTMVQLNPYQGNMLAGLFPLCGTVPWGVILGWQGAIPAAQNFSGHLYQLAGTDDAITPAAAAAYWSDQGELGDHHPARNILATVVGLGHFGSLDITAANQPIPFPGCANPLPLGAMHGADQHLVTSLFVTKALRADFGVGIQENIFDEILGSGFMDLPVSLNGGAPQPIQVDVLSRCRDTAVWVKPSSQGGLEIGIAGHPQDLGMIYAFVEEPYAFGILPGWSLLGAVDPAVFGNISAYPGTGVLIGQIPGQPTGLEIGIMAYMIGTDRTDLSRLATVHY